MTTNKKNSKDTEIHFWQNKWKKLVQNNLPQIRHEYKFNLPKYNDHIDLFPPTGYYMKPIHKLIMKLYLKKSTIMGHPSINIPLLPIGIDKINSTLENIAKKIEQNKREIFEEHQLICFKYIDQDSHVGKLLKNDHIKVPSHYNQYILNLKEYRNFEEYLGKLQKKHRKELTRACKLCLKNRITTSFEYNPNPKDLADLYINDFISHNKMKPCIDVKFFRHLTKTSNIIFIVSKAGNDILGFTAFALFPDKIYTLLSAFEKKLSHKFGIQKYLDYKLIEKAFQYNVKTINLGANNGQLKKKFGTKETITFNYITLRNKYINKLLRLITN